MVRDKLNNLLCINHRVESKRRQIERLNAVMEDVGLTTNYESERVQSSGKDVDSLRATIIDLKDSLKKEIVCLMAMQQSAKNMFKCLDSKQSVIMEMRYIEALPFREIARRTSYSEAAIFKIHRSAMDKLNSVLNK